MDKITLEVDKGLAQAWKKSTPEIREKCERKIKEVLRELREVEFDELLNKVGEIAEKNGLTEDRLNHLLNEKE